MGKKALLNPDYYFEKFYYEGFNGYGVIKEKPIPAHGTYFKDVICFCFWKKEAARITKALNNSKPEKP